MEQLYMIEIFIDKVTIYLDEDEKPTDAYKKLTIKIKFGPNVQFIVKEGQLALNAKKDDIVDADEDGKRKWSRIIRVGKSFVFPSYPDTVLMMLSKFPLEIEVWNDDENEVEIFVGVGKMEWDTQFFIMLKETVDACKLHEPLSIKQTVPVTAECCCRRVGLVSFILRISALGDSITTEFQQLLSNPEEFVFRTNKAPSMFKCHRVDGADPNFCMLGSLYETATLEDPDLINMANKKIEVCTERQSCAVGPEGVERTCVHLSEEGKLKKTYPIDKIRMGDITGPCGNSNCPLAHKVKEYIRNLEAYKVETFGIVSNSKTAPRKICGACDCRDDRYHRDKCPDNTKEGQAICKGCGGITQKGESCEDKANRLKGTGLSPKASANKVQINYMVGVTRNPELTKSLFGKDFIVENLTTKYNIQQQAITGQNENTCSCSKRQIPPPPIPQPCCTTVVYSVTNLSIPPNIKHSVNAAAPPTRYMGTQTVFNADVKFDGKNRTAVYQCSEIPDDKDCKCNPPKPTPPCKTFDCECLTETADMDTRKYHKPYCPSYRHKDTCPVTMMQEDEDKKKDEYEEDEAEPLPYGLPPISLGPCPVLGRPCSVPDGFARMYKIAAMPTQPPSYSDAGKVCCSKEYERIKKAIKEYLKNEKEHDFRCINKFNVDTERRCCDREQRLLSLMGKDCCGSHKMAVQEKFKEEKPEP